MHRVSCKVALPLWTVDRVGSSVAVAMTQADVYW